MTRAVSTAESPPSADGVPAPGATDTADDESQPEPISNTLNYHDDVLFGASRTVTPKTARTATKRRIMIKDAHASARGDNFTRLVWWTILGTFIPGAGLLPTRRWGFGAIALVVWTAIVSAIITYAIIGNPELIISFIAADPDNVRIAAVAAIALAFLWILIVVLTYVTLRPYAHPTWFQRIVGAVLVTSLVGLIAIPAATAGKGAIEAQDTIEKIFPNTNKRLGTDAWATRPRINVLLIGSDAGADRVGIRPDTLILASINTSSGHTTLFSLPRNMERVPFPEGTKQAQQYPNGFYCFNPQVQVNTDCLLNSMWMFGEQHWKEYYSQEKTAYDAGLRATQEAVQEVTGLKVDQYAMVNLRGFMQLVDAIGGLRLNVRQRLPIGGSSNYHVATGGWIEKGENQLLDGYHALWFARSRWSTDDYSRMNRQRCVIAAFSKQADVKTISTNFTSIMKVARDNITTDINGRDLGQWVTLASRIQKNDTQSIAFTSSVIDPSRPNFRKIRAMVSKALQPGASKADVTAAGNPLESKPTSTAVKPGVTPSAKTLPRKIDPSTVSTPANSSEPENLDEVC